MEVNKELENEANAYKDKWNVANELVVEMVKFLEKNNLQETEIRQIIDIVVEAKYDYLTLKPKGCIFRNILCEKCAQFCSHLFNKINPDDRKSNVRRRCVYCEHETEIDYRDFVDNHQIVYLERDCYIP